MDKLKKWSLLVLLPIAAGIGLIISGNYFKMPQLVTAGYLVLEIGVPLTMFAIVVVGLMLMVKGNSAGAANKTRAVSFVILALLLTCFALILVFAFLRIYIGAIICGALFVGSILIAIISVLIAQRSSMRKNVNPDKYDRKTGSVRSTSVSSSTSVNGYTTSVTYRVVVAVDGRDYVAYSKQDFRVGEVIGVFVRKDGKGTAVITDKSPEERKADSYVLNEELELRRAHIEELERELAERNAGEGERNAGEGEEDK